MLLFIFINGIYIFISILFRKNAPKYGWNTTDIKKKVMLMTT